MHGKAAAAYWHIIGPSSVLLATIRSTLGLGKPMILPPSQLPLELWQANHGRSRLIGNLTTMQDRTWVLSSHRILPLAKEVHNTQLYLHNFSRTTEVNFKPSRVCYTSLPQVACYVFCIVLAASCWSLCSRRALMHPHLKVPVHHPPLMAVC